MILLIRTSDNCNIKCAAGYMLKGPKTLTYQAKDGTQNGVWNNNRPTCVHECKL